MPSGRHPAQEATTLPVPGTDFTSGSFFVGNPWSERLISRPKWYSQLSDWSTPLLPVDPNAPKLKITLTVDGRIAVDGRPTGIDSLRVLLKRLAAETPCAMALHFQPAIN